MKKIILTLTLVGFIISAKAEKSAYIAKMKETLEEMSKCQTVEDFKNVANTFERISKMEKDEWLPLYYVADIQIILIYVDPQASAEQKDQYLDQAQQNIEELEELAPSEAEIQVLKAFLIASRMGIDPTARGAKYYPEYEATIKKAQQLDPENPRVKYMALSNEVGKAQWFGQSIAEYCPQMQKLYDNWDSHAKVSDIHPAWGKDQLAQLMQSCN